MSVSPKLLKLPKTHHAPIQAYPAQEGCAGNIVIGDVVDLKTARAVTQQHVGSVPAKETTERHKLPIGSDLAQVVSRQEAVAADIVDLVLTVGAVAQDHVRGGAGGRRRIRGWSRWSLAPSDCFHQDIIELRDAVYLPGGTLIQKCVRPGRLKAIWPLDHQSPRSRLTSKPLA